MLLLKDILQGVDVAGMTGDTAVAIHAVAIDSRNVLPGSLFVALRGTGTDGRLFIADAAGMGAVAVVCEEMPEVTIPGITYVQVADARKAAGLIADAFYGHPSEALRVVGITGTNGKTTTATLLYQLFEGMGYKCGLISTVQNYIHDVAEPSTHTTPDPVSLQGLLARMRDSGCTHVFMEVSSHAVHQERIAGISFAGGVFTNITHDHLDYHQTFDNYIKAKKLFFDGLPKNSFALVNADDRRGMVMLQNTAAEKLAYSLRVPADYKAKVLENNLTGLILHIGGQEAHFRMTGLFNAYNVLASYAVAVQLGADSMQALSVLSNLKGAPGRFETLISPNDRILGIVDYAHTPDALNNVLATIKQFREDARKIITVIGCGGDRDREKRPLMAEVATAHSDRVILTSDNPRSEDPERILDAMEEGVGIAGRKKTIRITDRAEAIKTACMFAEPGDILLIAGKGHEKYQEIKGVKYPFDDVSVLTGAWTLLNK